MPAWIRALLLGWARGFNVSGSPNASRLRTNNLWMGSEPIVGAKESGIQLASNVQRFALINLLVRGALAADVLCWDVPSFVDN